MSTLPAITYQPPRARQEHSNIFYAQQYRNSTRRQPPQKLSMPRIPDESDMEDDFPTPRANAIIQLDPTSAVANIGHPPTDSYRCSSVYSPVAGETQDDLYGVSDDDSEIVPIKISNSVRRMVNQEKLPTLIIPCSNFAAKASKAAKIVSPLQTPLSAPISPAILAQLQATALRVPSLRSAPSLDGSLASEEQRCMDPSTPSMQSRDGDACGWELPVQLHPQALDTLQHLHFDVPSSTFDTIVEASEAQVQEMQERGLHINTVSRVSMDRDISAIDPVSAISIPSPGGLFASLDPAAREVWAPKRSGQDPSTSTAEKFYNLPWGPRSSSITERVVLVDDVASEAPSTAKRVLKSPRNLSDIIEQRKQHEYDDTYDRKLQEEASSKLTRTSLWLSHQETYLAALGSANPLNAVETLPEPPQTPITAAPNVTSPFSSPASKKSVRFAADVVDNSREVEPSSPSSTVSDPLFYNAFQHLFDPEVNSREAFNHREYRADALQMQRTYVPEIHKAQLQGQYFPRAPTVPDKDFSHLPNASEDAAQRAHHEAVSAANRERDALQQISMSVWNLEAQRHLASGALLPRAAKLRLRLAAKHGRKPRVLDLGGYPTADWGWAVALAHRDATIHTAVHRSLAPSEAAWRAHRGPSNHRVVKIDEPWALPFPDDSFDVVSARTLHMLLRTSAARGMTSLDEYDATLAEVRRVLVPGGVFHFELLDAAVHDLSKRNEEEGGEEEGEGVLDHGDDAVRNVQPPGTPGLQNALAARSADFAELLCELAYDPCASATFFTRIVDAGFSRTERAWLSLPLDVKAASSSTTTTTTTTTTGQQAASERGVEAITGLAGSLAWERWMLKAQMEAGREGARLLDGVARALDSARQEGKEGMGWCMLTGCTTKAVKGKGRTW